MTFIEFLLEGKSLIQPNVLDKKSKKKIPPSPNVYKDKDAGAGDDAELTTVVVKDSDTGKVYGRRTIAQKKS